MASMGTRGAATRVGAGALALAVFGAGMLPGRSLPNEFLHDRLGLTLLPVAVVAGLLALAAGAATWLLPRQWPLVTVAFAGTFADSLGGGLCLIAATYVVSSRYQRLSRLVAFGCAALALAVAPVLLGIVAGVPGLDSGDLAGSLGGSVLFVWLPMAVGLWSRARWQVLVALRDRAEYLERERTEAQAKARAMERTRIAREMHDVVAHEVSLVVMHAGALEVNATDASTAESAELIRATGARALARLRDVLGVLRNPDDAAPVAPAARLCDLAAVVKGARAGGVDVTLRETGHARDLPTLVEHTAHRVVLEGLTNVRKHAGAVAATVELNHGRHNLDVTVHNEPTVSLPEPTPGGLGLIGLRERVALVGGELSAGPRPEGGFTLSATLPIEEV